MSFEPLLQGGDRWLYLAIVGLWVLANISFWTWWLKADHVASLPGFLLNTLLISVDLIEPGWFYFFVWRASRPRAIGPPAPFRVAAATTKTPSEPLEVVGETLLAIKAMHGEHDTWLLDEGGDPAVRAWCEARGIHYFSRKGIEKYQQPRWPFQSRMKAGNYNSWLDAVGYDRYDVFCQFDSDHKPQPDYMQKALVAFQRDNVAYVAAPSICHGNKEDSWAVLGRAEMEATFHGPLQAGFNDGYAPLIIGSHCTFRLSRLRELGGFQTTWCEDHDNTLAFNAMGAEGVFQIDAIAVGDGPTSFAEAMQQEFQWSRGLMQILLGSTPLWAGNLSMGKRIQFLFSQTWYPRLGLIKLGCVLLPGIALLTDTRMANVSYLEFLGREFLVGLPCLAAVSLLWARGLVRPSDIPFVTWRTPLFQMARWPWVLMACGEAVLGKLTGRDFAIKVTAKGKTGPRPLPIRVLWPYAAIIVFSVTVAELLRHFSPNAAGYSVIALVAAGWYTLLLTCIVVLHVRENAAEHSWAVALEHNRSSIACASAGLCLMFAGIGTHIELPAGPDLDTPELAVVAAASGRPITEATAGSTKNVPTLLAQPVPDVTLIEGLLSQEMAKRQSSVPLAVLSPFPAGGVTLGAYDPERRLQKFNLGAEVIFHSWQSDGPAQVDREMDRILHVGRLPVVTLLPQPLGLAALRPSTLLDDIGRGQYDTLIRSYALRVRAKAPNAVVVRFAPEMELTGAHAWARGDAAAYVRAYRHVIEVFQAAGVTNASWMWSPAGNDGAEAYYPGDAYVDLIGVTILASDQWDRAWGLPRTRTFADLMGEKYHLAERFDKPLVVAEAGVAISDPAAVRDWLASLPGAFAQFPRLRGFCYFNASQPVDTPQIGVFPDWRLAEPALLFGNGAPTS